jgi:anti-sigma factor RsiW
LSCDFERVTGFVDDELDPQANAAVAAHLESCPACRAQAEAERALRARLRSLPGPELPAGLEARVREARRVRPSALPAAARWALPLAAALLLGVWLRGYAPFVAWDLARDHDKCFARQPLPAKVWSGEPRAVADWFEQQGTRLPALPAQVGELSLVGARYCPLASLTSAPHVYYASAGRHVSVFVVQHGVRLDDRRASRARGDSIRLLHLEGELVGIVGEREADVQAFETALRPVLAAWASR